MALVNCPECKSEISDSATKCPKCGVQLIKATRSAFGKLIKYSFIAFNILMLIWLIVGMGTASQHITNTATQAEQAGAAIGTGIGAMLIIIVWVMGDIVLGLFTLLTRPKN